ncbi:MAG: ABC transporter permease [Halobacteriota archaeon]
MSSSVSDRTTRSMRQASAFAGRHVRVALRDRASLFWSFAWPILWYLLTVYLIVLPQLPAGTPPDVVSLVKTTQAVTFGIFGAITVSLVGFAGELTRDLEEKRYRALRAYPVSPTIDLGGRFVGSVLLGLAAFLAVVLVGVIDGATVSPTRSWPVAIGAVTIAVGALCGLCAAIATIVALVTNGRSQTNLLTLTIVMIAFFVTGFNGTQPWLIPGSTVEASLNYLPNTLATRLTLEALVGAEWGNAGLTPPGMPSIGSGLARLGGSLVVLSTLASVLARSWLYGGDAGE